MRDKRLNCLGEVCESITYGVTASADFTSVVGPHLLRITDITENGVFWETVPRCTVSKFDEANSLLRDGDIVVARTGGTVGKSFLLSNPPHAVNASYLLRLRPNLGAIIPEYLSQFLGSQTYWSQLLEAARGAAQPNVNATMLSEVRLPLPSLDVQCQIAARLKAQLAEVETARQAAQVQLREITKLADSIIYDSIKKAVPTLRTLGDVLDEVKKGIGQGWKNYPVLGATRGGLAPAKEQPGKQAPKYKPAFPGTVFYNPMRILIGSIAFVDEDDTPGITSPDYVALRGKEDVVDSRWFYHWLRSPLGEQCILSLARGAVRERMLFNRLAEGVIELPGFAEQKKASAALKQLRPLRRAIEQQLREIDMLPQKILAQAFEH